MITNNVLREASQDFSRHVYNDKIEKAERDISELAIQLVRKYLPEELVKAVEKYPQLLVSTDSISFSNNRNKVQAKIEGVVYPRLEEIRINSEDFQSLYNLIILHRKLKADRERMETVVYTILKTLQTYNLIIAHFPEIKPYLTPRVIPTENVTYHSNKDNMVSKITPILNSIREDIQR